MAERTFFQTARTGLGRLVPRSAFQIGIVLIFVTLIAGWGLFNKDKILSTIGDGTEITIEFDRQYRLRPFITTAKISGVPIGEVTDAEFADGRSIVTIKVNDDDVHKMGTEPEAEIRPATLLGGSVYIDIVPGGERPGRPTDDFIPAERMRIVDGEEVAVANTRIPVELDRVLDVIGSDAQAGLQASIVDSNDMLSNGGTEAFEGLLDVAPSALPPTGDVLDALNGRQATDLQRAIDELADVVRAVEGDGTQLDALLDGAAPVAATLGDEADALAAAIDDLPRTTTNARAALTELNQLLNTLDATAPDAIPVANELTDVLTTLRPVLTDARPVVADLRDVTADLTPALDDLGPMTADARDIVDDVDGEVIDRVVDPILTTVNSPLPFEGTSNLLYQELGYVLSGVNGFTSTMDANGRYQNFSPAVAAESLSIPGILDSQNINQAGPLTISPSDPTPAHVVVPTTIPADNQLDAPPSSVPVGTPAQDAGNPAAEGDGLGGPVAGDPYAPEGLESPAAEAPGPIDTESAAAVSPSDHRNSPWRIPILAIVAIAALVGWVLAYDVYRKGTSA